MSHFKSILTLLTLLIMLVLPAIAHASMYTCQEGQQSRGEYTSTNCDGECGGVVHPGSCVAVQSGPLTLDNPAPGLGNDPNKLIGLVINGVLGLVGSLALVMFIYGGLTWMLAGGAREKVQKGKDILIWATIGLIVIFASYAIIFYILENALSIN